MYTGEPILIYNLFPRLVGAMSSWGPHMDRARQMGFNYIYVNPLSYPGFSGSLYSVKDYYRMNPLFLDDSGRAEADQLRDMVNIAHEKGLQIVFDLVINHTAIDSVFIREHDDWYQHNDDGTVKNPQVWEGDKLITTWGDLAEIDNEDSSDRKGLWAYWNKLIRYYLDIGVDGFRCDAAYQVPIPLWKYLIPEAKTYKPNTMFFAETLGCEIEDVVALAEAGFDFAFNSSKWWDFKKPWCMKQYKESAPVIPSIAFAETHDTPRLADEFHGNEAAIKMRYLFSVVFSSAVMMPLGFEFGFRKQVDVVKTYPKDYEPIQIDLIEFIRRANALKKHAVFHEDSPLDIMDVSNSSIFSFIKTANDLESKALVIINTDIHHHQHVQLNLAERLGCPMARIHDVSIDYAMPELPKPLDYHLRPGQVMVFLAY